LLSSLLSSLLTSARRSAPDVMLAGVGQSIESVEVYGSPQISIFFQGNDHSLSLSHVHDSGRQCSDCGAFYMGREWTYR